MIWFGNRGMGNFAEEREMLKKVISSAKYASMLKELLS
jgi:hypothetical protein